MQETNAILHSAFRILHYMETPRRPTHLGLRHLALNVRALDAMKRFYVDLLGFEVEWEPDPDNVYLTSGRDNLALHRSLELAAGRSADDAADNMAAPGAHAPETSPLDHLGLIVATPDAVDQWAAFLQSRGVALDAAPRTHRDGARSCYFKDPDGNRIQIIHHPPISDKS
jgi:catechol 2,3-dioxygenase-like lactoylglutathione lyase family enzyme